MHGEFGSLCVPAWKNPFFLWQDAKRAKMETAMKGNERARRSTKKKARGISMAHI